jgi:hypothetical protein
MPNENPQLEYVVRCAASIVFRRGVDQWFDINEVLDEMWATPMLTRSHGFTYGNCLGWVSQLLHQSHDLQYRRVRYTSQWSFRKDSEQA